MSEPLRLLLVEDSVRDAHLLQAQVEDLTGGQAVDLNHAQSLADAIKMLGELHDCVLLDMNLPDCAELEGVDLIRRIAPSVPIVVLTGLEDEQLAQRALRHGAQEYLVKGHHDGDALVRRVQHAITRHRLMVDLEQQRQRDYHRASHDPLTGLPNRPLFLDRLNTALAQAQRHHSMVVVGFLDLDGFKAVNDRYGHALGDALLCRVAEVLSDRLRAGDTVARLGGDEFVLLLTQPHNAQEAGLAASRILSALAAIHEVDGQPVTIGGSLGLALFPGHAGDTSPESVQRPETLLLQADHAMYRAKAAGKGQWRLHGETNPPRPPSAHGGTTSCNSVSSPGTSCGGAAAPALRCACRWRMRKAAPSQYCVPPATSCRRWAIGFLPKLCTYGMAGLHAASHRRALPSTSPPSNSSGAITLK